MRPNHNQSEPFILVLISTFIFILYVKLYTIAEFSFSLPISVFNDIQRQNIENYMRKLTNIKLLIDSQFHYSSP